MAVLGTRGIPARYGGFETFAEQLSTRLVRRGVSVTVFCEAERSDAAPISTHQGVELQAPSKYRAWGASALYCSTFAACGRPDAISTSSICSVTEPRSGAGFREYGAQESRSTWTVWSGPAQSGAVLHARICTRWNASRQSPEPDCCGRAGHQGRLTRAISLYGALRHHSPYGCDIPGQEPSDNLFPEWNLKSNCYYFQLAFAASSPRTM